MERVPAFVQEGEALTREDLDGHARAFLRIALALAAVAEGDYDSAASQTEQCLALCRRLGDVRNTGYALYILGTTELLRGDLDRGETLLEEGIPIARDLEYRLGHAYTLLGLGKVAALRGKPDRAARLWGVAEALRDQLGTSLSHFDLVNCGYEQFLASARTALPEAIFEAAWAEKSHVLRAGHRVRAG
jgi:tetratricopeptide (TPR) repeat protein